jgi:NAD(P)-dependent dehydrogenase (short-subunit alcohol dehydrogenase family)
MSDLKGKVTGASKGIGAAIARALAAAGAAVVVNYASSRDGAERVVRRSAPSSGAEVTPAARHVRRARPLRREGSRRRGAAPTPHGREPITPTELAV